MAYGVWRIADCLCLALRFLLPPLVAPSRNPIVCLSTVRRLDIDEGPHQSHQNDIFFGAHIEAAFCPGRAPVISFGPREPQSRVGEPTSQGSNVLDTLTDEAMPFWYQITFEKVLK